MQEAYAPALPAPEHFTRLPDRAVGVQRRPQRAGPTSSWPDHHARCCRSSATHDFTTIEHRRADEGADPRSQLLAVLPGTTHMTATLRVDLLVPLLAAIPGLIGPSRAPAGSPGPSSLRPLRDHVHKRSGRPEQRLRSPDQRLFRAWRAAGSAAPRGRSGRRAPRPAGPRRARLPGRPELVRRRHGDRQQAQPRAKSAYETSGSTCSPRTCGAAHRPQLPGDLVQVVVVQDA
jgi:hypothetical protein